MVEEKQTYKQTYTHTYSYINNACGVQKTGVNDAVSSDVLLVLFELSKRAGVNGGAEEIGG